MSRYNRIARSLCAVIIAVCAVIPHFWVQADETKTYKYSLSVEFGSLAFYYDHGIWDPNEMNYVADEQSANPAQSADPDSGRATLDGYPGWYGFDDVANKIVVTNDADRDITGDGVVDVFPIDVTLSLSYRPFAAGEKDDAGNELTVVNGVGMEVLNGKLDDGVTDADASWSDAGGYYTTTLSRGDTAVALIQLYGKPTVGNNQDRYDSGNTMDPIGMIELRITGWK